METPKIDTSAIFNMSNDSVKEMAAKEHNVELDDGQVENLRLVLARIQAFDRMNGNLGG